jgi:hypothetical protein
MKQLGTVSIVLLFWLFIQNMGLGTFALNVSALLSSNAYSGGMLPCLWSERICLQRKISAVAWEVIPIKPAL